MSLECSPYRLPKHTGQFRLETPLTEDTDENVGQAHDRLSILQNIQQLEEEESSLKASLKQETQFNRRLTLNMNIKRCQQQIQKLTSEL